MNTRPDDSNRADEQAALWAAKLEGSELNLRERRELDSWLSQDASHRRLLSSYCQLSADLEEKLPVLVASGQLRMPSAPEPVARRKLALWFAVPILAAAIWALGLFLPGLVITGPESHACAAGQRKVLELKDGSRIELNAQTNLIVELGESERHVRLASGQAFFSVSKNQGRPFIVETPVGAIRVTGTAFDVRSLEGELKVTVEEGSVLVRSVDKEGRLATAPVALEAGNQLTSRQGEPELRTLNAEQLSQAFAWRQGQIVFDQCRLHEALAAFSHYHGRGIKASPAAGELRLGGRFSLDDINGFFSSLEEVLPVRVSKDLAGGAHVSLRTEP